MKTVKSIMPLNFGVLGHIDCEVRANVCRAFDGETSVFITSVTFSVPTKSPDVTLTADCLALLQRDDVKRIELRVRNQLLGAPQALAL